MKWFKVFGALFVPFSLTNCTHKGDGISTESESIDTTYVEQEVHESKDSNGLVWNIKDVDSIFMNFDDATAFKKAIPYSFEAWPCSCSKILKEDYSEAMCYRFSWDTVDQSLGHLVHPIRDIVYVYTLRKKTNNPNINVFEDPMEILVGFGGSFPVNTLDFPIIGLDSTSFFTIYGREFLRESSEIQARNFAIKMSDLYVFYRRAYELKVSVVDGKINYFEFLKNNSKDLRIGERYESIAF